MDEDHLYTTITHSNLYPTLSLSTVLLHLSASRAYRCSWQCANKLYHESYHQLRTKLTFTAQGGWSMTVPRTFNGEPMPRRQVDGEWIMQNEVQIRVDEDGNPIPNGVFTCLCGFAHMEPRQVKNHAAQCLFGRTANLPLRRSQRLAERGAGAPVPDNFQFQLPVEQELPAEEVPEEEEEGQQQLLNDIPLRDDVQAMPDLGWQDDIPQHIRLPGSPEVMRWPPVQYLPQNLQQIVINQIRPQAVDLYVQLQEQGIQLDEPLESVRISFNLVVAGQVSPLAKFSILVAYTNLALVPYYWQNLIIAVKRHARIADVRANLNHF